MQPTTTPIRSPRRLRFLRSALLACLCVGVVAVPAWQAAADETRPTYKYADDDRVGIEPNLGGQIPLDLSFNDENGNPVTLRSLYKRPTFIMLVYFGCPNICSKVLREVGKTVGEMDTLVVGKDYDLITVSFNAKEKHVLAKQNEVALLEDPEINFDPDGWHFLTGDEQSIMHLADAIGFRFKRDGPDNFKHAGTVVATAPGGKIISYLSGEVILPFDFEMAIVDAGKGTPRSLMQRVQDFCFAYDPEGKTYVLQINKIILFVTLFGVAVFGAYLFFRRRRPDAGSDEAGPDTATAATPEERPV